MLEVVDVSWSVRQARIIDRISATVPAAVLSDCSDRTVPARALCCVRSPGSSWRTTAES